MHKQLEKDDAPSGLFSYLNELPLLLKSPCLAKTEDEFLTFGNLTRTLSTRACFYVNQTTKLFKDSKLTETEKANERYSLNVQRMVKSHIHFVVYQMAKEYV